MSIDATPQQFATFHDAQQFLSAHAGGEPFDYSRDSAETMRVAESLGVSKQVERAIRMSRAIDPAIDSSIRHAELRQRLRQSEEAWPQPQPLPSGLPAVRPFDFELLPDSLRPWAEDICDRIQCPPDFVGATIAVGLGAVIGRRIGIRPQERTDWTEFPNQWGLIVGRPGVLKSPAMEQALAPLHRLTAKATDDYRTERERYEADARVTKMRRDTAEGEMRKRLKTSALANVDDLLIADPAEPQPRRYIANDTSYEALGGILKHNPNGILVYRDEAVSLLKTLDREDNAGARGFYLTGWAGNSPYTFDRITREGAALDAVCLSVLGSTQPGRLAEYIRAAVKGGAADDGLIQRFGVMVWPDTTRDWKDVDRYPDSEARTKAFEVFDRLDKLEPMVIGAEQDQDREGAPRGQPYLRFAPDALEAFRQWRQPHERSLTQSEDSPALISHFAKYRKLVPALALALHLAEDASGPVSCISTLRALTWAEYLQSHARRAYASLEAPELDAARAILERLRRRDLEPRFHARDIYRKGWARLGDRELINDALQLLVDLDWIACDRKDAGKQGGRSTVEYMANPMALQ